MPFEFQQRTTNYTYKVIQIYRRFFKLYIVMFIKEAMDHIDFYFTDYCRLTQPINKVNNSICFFQIAMFYLADFYKNIRSK